MHTSVVVVGAGPGGLAMSYHLTGAGVDHVLLERGEVAQLLANRALGLAPPPDPELDDRAARRTATRAMTLTGT